MDREESAENETALKRQVAKVLKASRPREDEFYRLWFDYLQLAFERNPSLKLPRCDEYRGWRDVRNKDFKTWEKELRYALARPCTRTLDPEEKALKGEITIAIRLDRSADLIRAELSERFMHQFLLMQISKRYTPVPEEKIQLGALREYWILYKARRQAEQEGKKQWVRFVCRYYNDAAKRYEKVKQLPVFPDAKDVDDPNQRKRIRNDPRSNHARCRMRRADHEQSALRRFSRRLQRANRID